MTTVTWRSRLEAAANERDVVGVVKDYLAHLDRFEIAQLPEECRPGKFFTADDVMAYAFTLARHRCEDDPDLQDFVLNLAAFFSQASYRLTQVVAHTNDDHSDTPQSV
ncbi:MAG: hypothetical protein M3R58_03100 [Pseudomonadota bacterium]|nr:hypothetical protein [Pseudomonadota bacterium]